MVVAHPATACCFIVAVSCLLDHRHYFTLPRLLHARLHATPQPLPHATIARPTVIVASRRGWPRHRFAFASRLPCTAAAASRSPTVASHRRYLAPKLRFEAASRSSGRRCCFASTLFSLPIVWVADECNIFLGHDLGGSQNRSST